MGTELRAVARRLLVFADIDGTLVSASGAISPRTFEVVRRLREQGHEFVLCTGRSRHAAERIATEFGRIGHGIILNGAVTVDWETGEVVDSVLIEADMVRRSAAIANEFTLGAVWLGAEAGHGSHYAEEGSVLLPRYVERNRTRLQYVSSFSDVGGEPASMAAYGEEAETTALAAAWSREFGETAVSVAGPTSAYGSWYAQLTAAGATKGAAAERLANRLGVPRHRTVALGDHRNDIELLRWCELGICMADGHPDAIAAADVVTGTLAEEGGAAALERYVLEENYD